MSCRRSASQVAHVITAGDMLCTCHTTLGHRIPGHGCQHTSWMREPLSAVQIANFLFC